ncbi:MFS transporter [Pseudofrankia inefficax]|uniref:Major facilitator superfamily MFS_1 n=1 Tax=Pseudofrankia inefficax (strain DSM 45817 / CECT 9037 / DDB 130130 / EuI1c) TaxID=298654 RepID=E3J1K5_PSEI1|nr:MFS transporter [Pseudofrankia inefficax]ADP81673.1 major facilitator superfamily MFS_1 [Pseudofrankia inefficax]
MTTDSPGPASGPPAPAATAAGGAAVPGGAESRRWRALAAAALGQLMVAADLTIMNIALPSAQRDLHMSDPTRQWVLTTFALGYGGFLLLGGRVGELLGRRRALLIGLAGFAAASALGGAAVDTGMLLAARGLQGVFGALFTPAALALLGTTFTVPAERARAFAIFGTVMGSSSGIGLILGGVLTGYLSWRYSMYIAVPLALVAAAVTVSAVPRSTPAAAPGAAAAGPGRGRVDVAGALLATVGLMALVFGFSRAQTDGWASVGTVASLVAGAVLLVAFVLVEARVPSPLLPLRVVLHRGRGGSYLATLAIGVAVFAGFFFLTYYLQEVLGYSPTRTGVAFLPLTAGLVTGARIVGRLIVRVAIRNLLVTGLVSAAAALTLIGLLRPDSSYWAGALPALVVLGFGMGWVMMPANSIATLGAGRDAGVAGGAVMTFQQIGASLGLALLGTIAGTATTGYLGSHHAAAGGPRALAQAAVVHGFNVASFVGAGFLAAAAVVVYLVVGPHGSTATGGVPAPADPAVVPTRPAAQAQTTRDPAALPG